MILKRLWWTIRMCMISGAEKRALYARKNNIFAFIGENVSFQPRIIPLYSELIKLQNNVRIASDVKFITHDGIHNMINRSKINKTILLEQIGCIEIGENSFIGRNSTIMFNVNIGRNVIVGSNSLVTKDLPDNGVYAGCPARKIGDYMDYVNKRVYLEKSGLISVTKHNQNLTVEDINMAWENFYKTRGIL